MAATGLIDRFHHRDPDLAIRTVAGHQAPDLRARI